MKMLNRKYIPCLLLIILIGLLSGCGGDTQISAVSTGTSILSWVAPSTIGNIQPANIAGYYVYYGTQSKTYTQKIDVQNVSTFDVTNFPVGTYFAVSAYNSDGIEGQLSVEIMKTT